jgi:Lamin Tail Domain/CotH kinase protein
MIFPMRTFFSRPLVHLAAVGVIGGFGSAAAGAAPAVVINEIHYHPVELETFNANGTPVLDLSDDVHEFIEIRNPGATPLTLTGWALTGGVTFSFPAGTAIAPGGYLTVAKNPARLQLVYAGLTGVLGPFSGTLSNGSDSVRLRDGAGSTVDEVDYDSQFPWPTGADAFGADDSFTLISPTPYQFKGRSLQRVSATAESNDPANWLASPIGSAPTPNAANAFTIATPRPVPLAYSVAQSSDDAPIIRAAATVRVNCTLSTVVGVSAVEVEYFVDNVNSYTEPRASVAMTDQGGGQFTAVLPGQVDRSVVRYRVRANLGAGVVQIAPRLDDAAIVPVGVTTREAWWAYFVSPVRAASPNPVYDLLVSDDGQPITDTAGANIYPWTGLNGLQNMAYNALGSPKRTTSSATSGVPRDPPFVAATDRVWNGTVPAIFIENGVVRDIGFRLHGSRYNRRPSRNSFKLRFPDTQKYNESDSQFITDKSDYFSVMHGLFVNAHLPVSTVRWIDWYLNGNARVTKLEQGEYNGDLLNQFHKREAALNPSAPKEENGEFYKNVGTIEVQGEGPYGMGDGRMLTAADQWSQVDRYMWTYLLQNNGWKGSKPMLDFWSGLWAARGDTATAPNPNIAATRTYLDTVLDVDTALTSLAMLNWACPWDDTTQNHFFWKRANGRWAHFPWDFDGMFGNGDTTGTNSWIYLGEATTPNPVSNVYGTILGNNFRGPNFYKDSVLKAYRAEFNEKLWVLNNTVLHPDTLKGLFFTSAGGSQVSYFTQINAFKAGFCDARFQSVNVQLGHAADGSDFTRPVRPTHTAPTTGATVLPPALLTASAYAHSTGSAAGLNAHAKSQWEIRRATGTYLTPILAETTTTSLTSLALPFDLLTFGETYFWRVTFIDGQNHPSVVSAETSFIFGPQPTSATLIQFSDPWKYNSTLTPTDTAWTTLAYDDTVAGWLGGTEANGKGTLAFETPGAIPETIRTTLPDPRTLTPAGRAYYFRRTFTFPSNPLLVTNLRIRHVIDDGAVIYINGQRIHRYYMNDAASYTAAGFSNGGPGEGVYQFADAVTNAGAAAWSWVDPRPFLVQGTNVISVEVHQTSGTSSDIVMGLEMTATLPATSGEVVINEVMTDNHSQTVAGTKNADWIELKNTTSAAVNIGGWGLTDDILVPTRYTFPANTIVPASGYLIVWCDDGQPYRNDLAPAPGPHTGFGLDRGGQRVVLTSGGALKDFVAFGPQARDLTLSRIPDGSGGFTLGQPTRAATNTAVATFGTVSALRINEWLASPVSGDDWFELHNTDANPVALAGLWLSDTLSSPRITRLPPLSFISGRGFIDLVADGSNTGSNRCNFKLAAGGERLVLSNTAATATLDSIVFGTQQTDRSQGRLPDGAATFAFFPGTVSRAASNWLPAPVVINEALSNRPMSGDDFIELHNPNAQSVDIGGWWLSDDASTPHKFQIPALTSIPPGGYFLLSDTLYDTPTGFALDSLGDNIILTAVGPGGVETGYRDQQDFGPADENVSFGRVLASPTNEFWPQVGKTPGGPNGAPKTTPLLINEVHYHPPDLALVDNVRDEFIELHNPTTAEVLLTGWKLKNGVDFAFPNGAKLRPGDYALVLSFNPALPANAALLADFRTQFALPVSVPLFGPYVPKLGNDRASVELSRSLIVSGSTGAVLSDVLVDKVKYTDTAPWPAADGNGGSLQRVSRSVIGNDAGNWVGLAPTPGAVNGGQSALFDNDGDGLPNSWEDTYGLDRFGSADAAAVSAADGLSNLLIYALNGLPGQNNRPTLPTGSVRTLSGQPYLTLQFTHRTGHPGLRFAVEVSTELIGWNSGPAASVQVSETDHGNGTATSVWRTAAAYSGAQRQMIRLRVSVAQP